MKKLYYKNKLVIRLIKPFENKRLFSPLKLNIYTLKDFNYWPEKVVALDAFCQTGLQWTRIFSEETSYLEMWDIDSEATKYAKKEFPNAKVVCGDSIDAIVNNKLGRKDFNFVLIDSPLPYQFADGSFEHFRFFDSIFNNIANEAVLILDVVPNMQSMLNRHHWPKDSAEIWAAARRNFYGSTDGYNVSPSEMIEVYTRKIKALGYEPKLVTYNARNEFFGFMTLVVSKK